LSQDALRLQSWAASLSMASPSRKCTMRKTVWQR
jgi:hypothetical protein